METRNTKATPRPSISNECTPRNRSNRVPSCIEVLEQKEKTYGYDSSDDDLKTSSPKDEVDRCTTNDSSNLYPDLSSISPGSDSCSSPESKPPYRTSVVDEFSYSLPIKCSSGTQKVLKTENPPTPKKGRPSKVINSKVINSNSSFFERFFEPPSVLLLMVLIFVCCIFLYQCSQNMDKLPSSKPAIKPIEDIYTDIKQHLKIVSTEFHQTRQFWVQIMGQLETIMRNNPIQPAVILSVVPDGAEHTAICLLHKIGQAVSDGFDDKRYIMYDVKSEVKKGSAYLKKGLYDFFWGLQDAHAAIVHNIEVIPGRAAMTFHAFCDNENAPFKQALIIQVIKIPGRYEDLAWDPLERKVDDYLIGKWGNELLEKDVSAIVSRVANAPVLIKPETASVLDTVCQNI